MFVSSGVATEGKAAALVTKTEDRCFDERYDAHTENTSEWSNESLADSSSVANLDLLGVTDSGAPEDEEEAEDAEYTEDLMAESGSGETLCEPHGSPFSSRSDNRDDQHHVKPPNVLVYCGTKDATRKFGQLKSVLENCINCDRYVIYHLKHDQVLSTPWAENTELLLISADTLYDKSDDAFCQYFENGGKILNFGSNFDAMFVPRRDIRSKKGISKVTYDTWTKFQYLCGRYAYSSLLTPKEYLSSVALAHNEDNHVIVIELTRIDVASSLKGKAILSQASRCKFTSPSPKDILTQHHIH